MKTALISDIHGNFSGLVTTLSDIEEYGCDRIICLGDLVDGGWDNEAVVKLIQQANIPCVRGNHDEYPFMQDSLQYVNYFHSLPENIIEDNVCYTHISTRAKGLPINNCVEAWNVFTDATAQQYRLIFVGHSHIAAVFREISTNATTSEQCSFVYNEPFYLKKNSRYIISVGAIGYSRDYINKIRYTIYDQDQDMIEMRMIEGEMLF